MLNYAAARDLFEHDTRHMPSSYALRSTRHECMTCVCKLRSRTERQGMTAGHKKQPPAGGAQPRKWPTAFERFFGSYILALQSYSAHQDVHARLLMHDPAQCRQGKADGLSATLAFMSAEAPALAKTKHPCVAARTCLRQQNQVFNHTVNHRHSKLLSEVPARRELRR